MGKTLKRLILGGWVLCAILGVLSFSPALLAADEGTQVILEADSVVYDQQAGTARAVGHARVQYGLLRLSADSIDLDQEMNRLKAFSPEAHGVHLRWKGQSLDGNELEYRIDEQAGILSKARGEANAIRFEGDSVEFAPVASAKAKGWIRNSESKGAVPDDLLIRGSEMSFTTCKEETPAYRLHTRRLLFIPGKQVIAVKPRIYIEEHFLASYPFDYRIDLKNSTAQPVVPSLFYDGTRGAGVSLRYGFQAGENIAGDVDLRVSANQGLEGTAGATFSPYEGVEAFANTSYIYNSDEDEKRWRPSWGLRSTRVAPDSWEWNILWSERESVDIRRGTGDAYKGTLWRDPELSFASPWWGGEVAGESQVRLLGTWGRYDEEGKDYERNGFGLEMKGKFGSTATFEPFWWGRAYRYSYDTDEDRTVIDGRIGVRWERKGWRFETRFDRRWVDGSTPMEWDFLDEIEEAYQTVDWPLSGRWRFAVRAGYDFRDDGFHEMAYRLAYDRECYRFEVFYVDDRAGDDDTAGIRLVIKAFPDKPLFLMDPGDGGFAAFEEAFP